MLFQILMHFGNDSQFATYAPIFEFEEFDNY